MNRRPLSDEDRALWAGLTRSVTPLRSGKIKARPGTDAKAQASAPPPRPAARQHGAPSAKPLPLAPLQRRLKQRLARGRDAIDIRIDLHGMTQRQAYAALLRFLRRAQAEEARIALVVTGKGGGGDPRDGLSERGVLWRQVPLWLELPEFRRFIVGFEEAHVAHGGQGALYVRLRRARTAC